MLLAQFPEYLVCRLCTASLEIRVAFPNSRYSLTIVLLLPFEICCKHIIERRH